MAGELGPAWVFFLDLLGFSDATRNWRGEKAGELLELLVELSSLRGTFNLDGHPQPDGSYKFHDIRPEFSTFSDCIVGSFNMPDSEGNAALEAAFIDMWLHETTRWISVIAARLLRIGLLVRGGLTMGNIYHANGVVFGEGLVEAYTLESRVANYPRVILAPTLAERLTSDHKKKLLLDHDGLFHINYFCQLFDQAVKPGKDFLDDATKWADEAQREIDARIEELNSADRIAEAAKWAWFREAFGNARRARIG